MDEEKGTEAEPTPLREELKPEVARAAEAAWVAYETGQDPGDSLEELEREVREAPARRV